MISVNNLFGIIKNNIIERADPVICIISWIQINNSSFSYYDTKDLIYKLYIANNLVTKTV